MDRKLKRKKGFSFVGRDSQLNELNERDGTLALSPAKKFELICDLTLFHYQRINNTNDIPRFLRTTACIRKS